MPFLGVKTPLRLLRDRRSGARGRAAPAAGLAWPRSTPPPLWARAAPLAAGRRSSGAVPQYRPPAHPRPLWSAALRPLRWPPRRGSADSGRIRRAWTLALGCLLAAAGGGRPLALPEPPGLFQRARRRPARGLSPPRRQSSLDWGQDLPGVKVYRGPEGRGGPGLFLVLRDREPAAPTRSPAQRLYSFAGNDVPPPVRILNPPVGQEGAAVAEALRLDPGYEVSGARRAQERPCADPPR